MVVEGGEKDFCCVVFIERGYSFLKYGVNLSIEIERIEELWDVVKVNIKVCLLDFVYI